MRRAFNCSSIAVIYADTDQILLRFPQPMKMPVRSKRLIVYVMRER